MTSVYQGHRERVRQKLQEFGGRSFADYELLEFLLFFIYPRLDVRPLARHLLEHFGSLTGLLYASRLEIISQKGMGEKGHMFFQALKVFYERLSWEEARQPTITNALESLVRYTRLRIDSFAQEHFFIFAYNAQGVLLADAELHIGTIDAVTIYPREIIKYILHHNAQQVTLLHTHPSGDTSPSEADKNLTRLLQELFSHLGVELRDHLIVSESSYFSMRQEKLL